MSASLRSRLIRLAHEKPELRPTILPLLEKNASTPEVKLVGDLEKSLHQVNYNFLQLALNLSKAKSLFKGDAALSKATETYHKELTSFQKDLASASDKFFTAVSDAATRGFLKEGAGNVSAFDLSEAVRAAMAKETGVPVSKIHTHTDSDDVTTISGTFDGKDWSIFFDPGPRMIEFAVAVEKALSGSGKVDPNNWKPHVNTIVEKTMAWIAKKRTFHFSP